MKRSNAEILYGIESIMGKDIKYVHRLEELYNYLNELSDEELIGISNFTKHLRSYADGTMKRRGIV